MMGYHQGGNPEATSSANLLKDNRENYTTWHQIAGYFDGDGSVTLNPEMFTVSLGLDWADSYKLQLEGVQRFLTNEGLKPAQIYAMGKENPVWHLRLTKRADLLRALSKITPLLIKKKDQVDAANCYLQNEITAEELIEEFNEATRTGTRSGYLRTLRMPYKHDQGVAKAQENGRKRRSAMNRISPSVLNAVGNRKKNGTTLREISDAIGVSPSSIRRSLAREGNKASPSAERTHKSTTSAR
jgi:hypothetical protein